MTNCWPATNHDGSPWLSFSVTSGRLRPSWRSCSILAGSLGLFIRAARTPCKRRLSSHLPRPQLKHGLLLAQKGPTNRDADRENKSHDDNPTPQQSRMECGPADRFRELGL